MVSVLLSHARGSAASLVGPHHVRFAPATRYLLMLTDAAGHAIPIDRPRSLFPQELERLARRFPELARDLIAGSCPDCDLNRTSSLHKASCERPEPLAAPSTPIQPWTPRPSRRAA